MNVDSKASYDDTVGRVGLMMRSCNSKNPASDSNQLPTMSDEDEIEQAMERLQELQTKVGRYDEMQVIADSVNILLT